MNTENTTTPIDDSEAWENGTLGQSLEHAAVSTVDPKTIDDALGIELVSFRLNKDIVEPLDDLARLNNSSRNALIQEAVAHFVCHNELYEDVEDMLYVAFNKIATYRHNTPEFSLARINKFLSLLNEINSWAGKMIGQLGDPECEVTISLEYLRSNISGAIGTLSGHKPGKTSIGRKGYISLSDAQYDQIVAMFLAMKEAYTIIHQDECPRILSAINNALRLSLVDIANRAFLSYSQLADRVILILGPDLVNLNLSDENYKRVADRATELQIEPADLVINALVANSQIN